MKKLLIQIVLCVLLILAWILPVCVSAWAPDNCFLLATQKRDVPENTAYIELLMQIPSGHEAYVDFNERNGILHGIAEDSEIVKYCEDGYISYTFHVVDAISRIEPYDANYYDDEYLFTDYGGDSYENSDIQYDYDYCRRAFKSAKFAYIDENGNILAVSNAVKTDYIRISAVNLGLHLTGTTLETNLSSAPPIYLGIIFYAGLIVCLAVFALWGIVVSVRKSKEKR